MMGIRLCKEYVHLRQAEWLHYILPLSHTYYQTRDERAVSNFANSEAATM
jgi:hypothetical protein